jgi:hypothetical protein
MQAPRPKLGRFSTYTVLGFVGYVVATALATSLAVVWDFTLGERVVAVIVPPVAFIVVVAIASVLRGREWIVFYQTTFGAVASVILIGFAIDGRIARLVDTTLLGIGTFLVFGRLGCFSVACCHGRLARRGVIYREAHVDVGLWRPYAGRPLVPIQLIESAATLVLVIAGVLVSATPGTAALVFATGYAILRFVLELWRGDPVRPFVRGLSEAQWCCLFAIACVGVARPSPWTAIPAAALFVAAAALVARRRRAELLLPPHLHELDRMCDAVLADANHARRDTSLGVGASCHTLPDGRLDWVLSSQHPTWSAQTARAIAAVLWPGAEIVEGRTAGIIHVVVPARAAA